MQPVKRTWPETIQYYKDLRQLTYDYIEKRYRNLILKASEISHADATEADLWSNRWNDAAKRPTWSWLAKYNIYQRSAGVKRFDIALRVGGQLCALCYGIPSRKKLILKLHLLSSNPQKNPLRGETFRIVLISATMYGGLIGAKEIWLVDPLNDDIAAHYAKFGFKLSYSKAHAAKYFHRSL